MQYAESILKVLVVGLVLGAGLPAVFALGLRAYSSGAGGTNDDGTTTAPNPALKYLGIALFLFVAWVIVTVRIESVAAGPNCTPVSRSKTMPIAVHTPI